VGAPKLDTMQGFVLRCPEARASGCGCLSCGSREGFATRKALPRWHDRGQGLPTATAAAVPLCGPSWQDPHRSDGAQAPPLSCRASPTRQAGAPSRPAPARTRRAAATARHSLVRAEIRCARLGPRELCASPLPVAVARRPGRRTGCEPAPSRCARSSCRPRTSARGRAHLRRHPPASRSRRFSPNRARIAPRPGPSRSVSRSIGRCQPPVARRTYCGRDDRFPILCSPRQVSSIPSCGGTRALLFFFCIFRVLPRSSTILARQIYALRPPTFFTPARPVPRVVYLPFR